MNEEKLLKDLELYFRHTVSESAAKVMAKDVLNIIKSVLG